MTPKENKPTGLTDAIKKYIELKLEYVQLSAAEKVSLLIGDLVLIGFFGILALILLLLFILLGYNLLVLFVSSAWMAALIEIGVVCLLVTLLWIFREKWILRPVGDRIIRTLLNSQNKREGDDDDE